MANITADNIGKQDTVNPRLVAPRWEPLRVMRSLLGWDPHKLATDPHDARLRGASVPDFEVNEVTDGYTFTADVFGVKAADLEVTATGNRLTVAGKTVVEREEQCASYFTCEHACWAFRRCFTLPDDVDSTSVRANLERGVLTVSVRKAARAPAEAGRRNP